jgi:hypothetical protein
VVMALRLRNSKSADRRPLQTFRVFRIRGASSRLICRVQARDEKDVIDKAVASYGIASSERARMYARSD